MLHIYKKELVERKEIKLQKKVDLVPVGIYFNI